MAKVVANTVFDPRTIFDGDTASSVSKRDNTVIDTSWIKSRFMVSDNALSDSVKVVRYKSVASLKYTNTSMGGNIFINPRPQFNALTDPKAENIAFSHSKVYKPNFAYNSPTLDPDVGNTGMGEGYSGLIDDNQQVVFMEFGLPKFNSLIDFFFRAVDYEDSILANTGRPADAYNLGKKIGVGLALIAFPVLAVTIWAIQLAAFVVLGDKSLKYYYFNAKMHMYWGTVNTLVTQLVTEQGVLHHELLPDSNKSTGATQIGLPTKISQGEMEKLNELIPGAIDEDTNYIDVFAIVTKAQRRAMLQKRMVYEIMNDEKTITDDDLLTANGLPELGLSSHLDNIVTFGTYLSKINAEESSEGPGDAKSVDTSKGSVDATLLNASTKSGVNLDNVNTKTQGTSGYPDGVYIKPKDPVKDGTLQRMAKVADASIRQGGAYAVFGVEYTGSTTESFSNSTTSINLGDQAKQISNKSRALSFDMARGNMLGDTFGQDVINAVGDVVYGIANSATFNLTGVMASLMGNAYVEMPKRWDDSTMSFQQHTYKMSLVSPYNSFLSQLQNMYLPLCMVLGGVLPLATGKSSYTSPYLCTLFCRGLENIQLGMITSVSVTRGTSTLGFDKKRNPLALEVSFTVTDFSTLVTSPVNSSVFTNTFTTSLEDDTPLGNYISVLGNRDLLTNRYLVRKIPLKASQMMMRFEQAFSVDRIGFLLGESLVDTLGMAVSQRSLPGRYNK